MAQRLLDVQWNIIPPLTQKELRLMSLIGLLITLVAVGVILWLINTYIPMDGKIKKILNVVVVIVVILWLLSVFGVLGTGSNLRMGNFRTSW